MLHVLHSRSSPVTLTKIKAQKFHATFQAYLGSIQDMGDLSSLGVDEIDTGPFGDCLVCAQLPRDAQVDGRRARMLHAHVLLRAACLHPMLHGA
jgi:hypothetical protein